MTQVQPTIVVSRSGARYRCLRELGCGGMAQLFLALTESAPGFEKLVALKRVHPHLARDEELQRMFRAEAELSAQLEHPNIAHVSDLGTAGGELFFVMEYIHGADVRRLLKASTGPLPLDVALTIAVGVAAGLHYAHCARDRSGRPMGIVHRDVSPSNVMTSAEGATLVVDFGVARVATANVATESGVLKGKMGYMSPEQCRGERVDARSDVFGLGILLYEMTTGRRCFSSDNYFLSLNKTQRGEYTRPRALVAEYPRTVEAIVCRALEGKPEDRYPSAEAMQLAMEQVAVEMKLPLSQARLAAFVRQHADLPPDPRKDVATVVAAAAHTLVATSPSAKRRRRRPVAVVAAGVIGLAAAGTVYMLSPAEAAEESEVAEPDHVVEPASEPPMDEVPPVATPAPSEPAPAVEEPSAEPVAPTTPTRRPRNKRGKKDRRRSSASGRPQSLDDLLPK